MSLDWSRCPVPPFEHQKAGVEALLRHPQFALFDEMGAGKTFQIVTAGSFLYELREVTTVVVVLPAGVRSVWPEEIKKYCFVPHGVFEFTSRGYLPVDGQLPRWPGWVYRKGDLLWVLVSYEFLRQPGRIDELLGDLVNSSQRERTWVVLDESSRIKSPSALQTKACWKLGGTFRTSWREVKVDQGRVVPAVASPVVRKTILNGTPIANSPLDLYAQFRFLDPAIVGVENFTHMRARYAVTVVGRTRGGQRFPQVVGYQNLEDLRGRVAPYVLRRLKKDCLDLPEKVYSSREVRLSPDVWRLYESMRDDAVASLAGSESVAFQSGVKLLRLAQLTSGFLGGVEKIYEDPTIYEEATATDGTAAFGLDECAIPGSRGSTDSVGILARPADLREVGREKLDALVELVDDLLTDDPLLKLLIWCRFRAELERVYRELGLKFSDRCYKIYGSQSKDERRQALDALTPGSSAVNDSWPACVVGIPAAGGLGLNLTAAHTVVYLTNDFSLLTRQQSEDRVHRPPQRFPCTYLDVLAVGPQGQKTIDHVVQRALRAKEDVARWTAAAWRRELTEGS